MDKTMNHHEYTGHSIWISRLVEYTGQKFNLPPAVSALFTIGLIPYVLTAVFFLLADGSESLYVVTMQTLAATVATIGPVLIWRYDEYTFPNFISEVSDIIPNQEMLIKTIDQYEHFFQHRYWLITVPWVILIESAMIANIGFFETLGVNGILDPAFLTYLIFAAWWSVITGIGLHGGLTTILCIRAVGDLELTIDPLHHDGLGGLGNVGYFSIRATLMISIGSLTLPLAFAIANEGGYGTLVYVAVAAYIGTIIFSFLYPTLYINRRAQEVRDRVLQKKREKIQSLKTQSVEDSADGNLSELETQLKIQTLRDDYHEYRSVNLYPLSVSILTRLISSVLLPIGFTLFETYIVSG